MSRETKILAASMLVAQASADLAEAISRGESLEVQLSETRIQVSKLEVELDEAKTALTDLAASCDPDGLVEEHQKQTAREFDDEFISSGDAKADEVKPLSTTFEAHEAAAAGDVLAQAARQELSNDDEEIVTDFAGKEGARATFGTEEVEVETSEAVETFVGTVENVAETLSDAGSAGIVTGGPAMVAAEATGEDGAETPVEVEEDDLDRKFAGETAG